MSQNNEILATDQAVGDTSTAIEPTGDGDIFKEIFGEDNTNRFVANANDDSVNTTESQAPEVSDSSNPKESVDQFNYWQSQADKRTAEVNELKQELDQIKSKISSTPSSQAKAEPESKDIVKPIKPTRPSSFDNSEALTDPDSKSAKYVAAREMYLDDMSEYLLNQEEVRNQVSQKQQAEQQKLNSQQKLYADLQGNYGYKPEEAKDFIERMSSPESLSLDNLVKLHKTLTTPVQQAPVQQQNVIDPRTSDMARRQQKLSIPSTITTQPSANVQSSKKIEDQMMDSMISNFKKKNPF